MKTTKEQRDEYRRNGFTLWSQRIAVLDDLDEGVAAVERLEQLQAAVACAVERLSGSHLRSENEITALSGLRAALAASEPAVMTCRACNGLGSVIVETTFIGELRGRCERCGATGQEPRAPVASQPTVCGIPSYNIGACEQPWGHVARVHSNGGDMFYARDYDEEHRRRQDIVRRQRIVHDGVLKRARQEEKS